jgi:hypothetical protein
MTTVDSQAPAVLPRRRARVPVVPDVARRPDGMARPDETTVRIRQFFMPFGRTYSKPARSKGPRREDRYGGDVPVPLLIPIAHEPDFRTARIGRYDDGLFFTSAWAEYAYVHHFDRHGVWVELYPDRLGFHEPWDGFYDT